MSLALSGAAGIRRLLGQNWHFPHAKVLWDTTICPSVGGKAESSVNMNYTGILSLCEALFVQLCLASAAAGISPLQLGECQTWRSSFGTRQDSPGLASKHILQRVTLWLFSSGVGSLMPSSEHCVGHASSLSASELRLAVLHTNNRAVSTGAKMPPS